MNEFSGKKLGEVGAFAVVGIETLERARPALISVWDEAIVTEAINHWTSQREKLGVIAEAEGVSEPFAKKVDGTGTKLRQMRDMYIGDEWDNPSEVFEWLGFFLGAAIVHWELVRGIAEVKEHAELLTLAQGALEHYHEVFAEVCQALNQVGNKRAQE